MFGILPKYNFYPSPVVNNKERDIENLILKGIIILVFYNKEKTTPMEVFNLSIHNTEEGT